MQSESDSLSPIPKFKSKRIISNSSIQRGNEVKLLSGITQEAASPIGRRKTRADPTDWEELEKMHHSAGSIQFKLERNSMISHQLKSQHLLNALLAGIMTLIILGVTVWFAFESISAFLAHSKKITLNFDLGTENDSEAILRTVEMTIYPILAVLIVGVIFWLRTRRTRYVTQYIAPILATIIYFVQFSLAITNLIFALIWNTNLASRCTWGIDVVWDLGESGNYCGGTERGDIGLRWVIAGSVRLVVTTLVGTFWLYLLKRFYDSLQLLSRPMPQKPYIGTSDYLPPMPLHSAHYRFQSSTSDHPTGKSENWSTWLGSSFWSGFDWILGVTPYSHPLEQSHHHSESSNDLIERNNENRMSWPNERKRQVRKAKKEIGEFGEKDGPVGGNAFNPKTRKNYQKVDLHDPVFSNPRNDKVYDENEQYDGGAPLVRSKTEPTENNQKNGKNKELESQGALTQSTPAKQYKKLFDTFYNSSATLGPSTTKLSPKNSPYRAPHPSRPNDIRPRLRPTSSPSNLANSTTFVPPILPSDPFQKNPSNFLPPATFSPLLTTPTSGNNQIRTGSSGSTNGSLIFVRMSDGKLVRKLSTIASEASGEETRSSIMGFSSSSIMTGYSPPLTAEGFDDHFQDYEIRKADRRQIGQAGNQAWKSDQTL